MADTPVQPDITNTNTNTQPTPAQADQYSETASNIDANQSAPVPSGPPGVPPVPTNPTQTPTAPVDAAQNQPVAPQAQKGVQDLSKAPPQTGASGNPPAPPQVTQKASWVHDIAQTMAGGPRYTYSIDPSTGEMKKVPVPVSTKHLALAIALEAIGGATTSLAEGKGAGNKGKGYAAAFQQGQQQVKEQDQKQQQLATQQYARQANIAQTNMQMLRNEQISSQADSELQQKTVDAYSDEFKEAQDGGFVKQMGITGDQVQQMLADKKLGITSDMLIPYEVVQQVGQDGKPLMTPHGAPKFEKRYALVDPLAEITPSDDLIKRAQDAKLPGFVNGKGEPLPLSSDLKMRIHQVSGIQEKLRSYDLNDSAIEGLEKGYDHVYHSGTAPVATDETTGQPTSLIKDPVLSDLNEKAASRYDLSPLLFSAVASQESSGNVHVSDSKPNKSGVYAIGPYQVTPGTAAKFTNPDTGKPYTEAEIRDPEKNADVAAHLLSNLVQANNGDVHKALVDYHGKAADSLGMTGEHYAAQVMSRIPSGALASENTTGTTAKPATPEIPAPPLPMKTVAAIQKGVITPSDVDVLNNKLGGLATLLDGNWSTKDIQNMAEKGRGISPDSVGRLLNWVGPSIDYRYAQKQQVLNKTKEGYAVELAGQKEEQKQALEQKYASQSADYLKGGEDFKDIPNATGLTPAQLTAQLKTQGIPVPPEIGALQIVANYGGPIEKFFPSKVYKGTPTISAQDAASYIKSYVNPNFNENMYSQAHQKATDYGNTSVGKPGGTLNSIDTASQHLQVLQNLAGALDNGQIQTVNQAHQWLAQHFGQSAPMSFNAVAQVLGQEVGKVTGGGAALESELQKFDNNLNVKEAPNQIRDVVNQYVNLMQGRLDSLNNDYKQYFNKDVRKMTSATAAVYGSRGYYVPGYGSPFKGSDGKLYFSMTGNQKDAVPLQ